MYFESLPTETTAAKRERQLKRMLRAEKVALIEAKNPEWQNIVPTTWGELLALE